MYKYVEAMLDDLEHLHFIKAFVQLQKFIYHLKSDLLSQCDGMGEDLATIESWATIFENPEYLGETLTVNYFKNKA